MKQQEDHLPNRGVRPRFKIYLPNTIEDLTKKIKDSLRTPKVQCRGKVIHGHITLFMPEEQQHYWSPQLSINIEDNDEGEGSVLRGLYGPRPSVWTMFVFFYAAIGFAIMVISIIGFSRLTLEKSATILWFIPALCILFLTLYLVAYFGRKLGHDEMETLHVFLENALGIEIDAHED